MSWNERQAANRYFRRNAAEVREGDHIVILHKDVMGRDTAKKHIDTLTNAGFLFADGMFDKK